MKKYGFAWILVVCLLISTHAFATEIRYPYIAEGLSFTMGINESWLPLIQSGKLSFFRRTDDTIKQSGMRGYALFYNTPDLTDFPGGDYAEAENWLNANAILLGGVAVHDTDLPESFYPELRTTTLGIQGNTTFTLLRTDKPDDAAFAEIWTGLADADRFSLSDPDSNPGLLGVFSTPDIITGADITQDILSQAQLTVVNFWGTFCPPCIEEMPAMGKLATEYSDKGVQFLGIVTDLYDANSLELAKEIVEKTGAHYMHIAPVVDPRVLSTIQYIPTTYFLDANGQPVSDRIVSSMDETNWRNAIESRLALIEG